MLCQPTGGLARLTEAWLGVGSGFFDPGLPRVTGASWWANGKKPCKQSQVQGDRNRERVSMLG